MKTKEIYRGFEIDPTFDFGGYSSGFFAQSINYEEINFYMYNRGRKTPVTLDEFKRELDEQIDEWVEIEMYPPCTLKDFEKPMFSFLPKNPMPREWWENDYNEPGNVNDLA